MHSFVIIQHYEVLTRMDDSLTPLIQTSQQSKHEVVASDSALWGLFGFNQDLFIFSALPGLWTSSLELYTDTHTYTHVHVHTHPHNYIKDLTENSFLKDNTVVRSKNMQIWKGIRYLCTVSSLDDGHFPRIILFPLCVCVVGGMCNPISGHGITNSYYYYYNVNISYAYWKIRAASFLDV